MLSAARCDIGRDMATKKKPKPITVKLSAESYLLGSPEFARPALSQEHKLLSEDYLHRSPEFETPVARRGRIIWGEPGRRRKIPEPAKSQLIAALKHWLEHKRATAARRILQKDPAVMEHVRHLAENAGVRASDTILLRQIIRPAFPNARRKKRP